MEFVKWELNDKTCSAIKGLGRGLMTANNEHIFLLFLQSCDLSCMENILFMVIILILDLKLSLTYFKTFLKCILKIYFQKTS